MTMKINIVYKMKLQLCNVIIEYFLHFCKSNRRYYNTIYDVLKKNILTMYYKKIINKIK